MTSNIEIKVSNVKSLREFTKPIPDFSSDDFESSLRHYIDVNHLHERQIYLEWIKAYKEVINSAGFAQRKLKSDMKSGNDFVASQAQSIRDLNRPLITKLIAMRKALRTAKQSQIE